MKLNLPANIVAFLRSVLPTIFPSSTQFSQSDLSVLDDGMQQDWRSQLNAEALADADLVLKKLNNASDPFEVTDEEAEALLRSLSGVRLYLANTVLADTNIENLEQALMDALSQNNLEIIRIIQLYHILCAVESEILENLTGE